jgi:hypothetical protein
MRTYDDPRHWRMKAEELRTVAEAATSQGARETFMSLARSYELLADRAEARAKANADAKSDAG